MTVISKGKKGSKPLSIVPPAEEKPEMGIILGEAERLAFDKWAYTNLTGEAKEKVIGWLLQQPKGYVKRLQP